MNSGFRRVDSVLGAPASLRIWGLVMQKWLKALPKRSVPSSQVNVREHMGNCYGQGHMPALGESFQNKGVLSELFTQSGLVVLALAVLLRIMMLIGFKDQQLTIVDEQQYDAIASNLVLNGEFADAKGRVTALRPPLYPLFLAAVYSIAGSNNYLAVRGLQACLGLSLGLICLIWARTLFDRRTATLAAAICILYPTLLLFDFLLLSEILFTALFLAFFVCVAKFWEQGKILYLGMGGLCLGLASLARSITYPMLLPAAALLVVLSRNRRKQALRGAFLMVAIFGLTLTPWIVRNYHVFGRFVPVDTMGGWNLYLGNFEHTLLHRAWATIDDRQTPWYEELGVRLEGLNEAEKQEWLGNESITFIKSHLGLTTFRAIIKAANLWGLDRTFIAAMSAGSFPFLVNPPVQALVAISILLSYAVVAIGGIFALAWRVWRERHPADLLVAFVVVYFTGMHGLVFGHPRYLIPLIPILCGYAAWGMINFRQIRAAGAVWKIFLGVVISVFGVIWTYEVLVGSRDRLTQAFHGLFN
jgi:4-amino-4-deoxy-L-arabinose transferase-like glycosyltransferase